MRCEFHGQPTSNQSWRISSHTGLRRRSIFASSRGMLLKFRCGPTSSIRLRSLLPHKRSNHRRECFPGKGAFHILLHSCLFDQLIWFDCVRFQDEGFVSRYYVDRLIFVIMDLPIVQIINSYSHPQLFQNNLTMMQQVFVIVLRLSTTPVWLPAVMQ